MVEIADLVIGGGALIFLLALIFFGGEVTAGLVTLLVVILMVCLFVRHPLAIVIPIVLLICLGGIRWYIDKKRAEQYEGDQKKGAGRRKDGRCLLTIAGFLLICPTVPVVFFYGTLNYESNAFVIISLLICLGVGGGLLSFNMDKGNKEDQEEGTKEGDDPS